VWQWLELWLGERQRVYNIVGIQLEFTLWCVNASQDFQLHAVTSMAVTSMGAWFRASRMSRMREGGWNHLKSVYSMAISSTWLWKALCWKTVKLVNSPQSSYGLQFQHSKLILQLQLQLVSTTQPVGWILTNEWVWLVGGVFSKVFSYPSVFFMNVYTFLRILCSYASVWCCTVT